VRLALFGATGRTGRLVLARALEDGHQVVAHTRNLAKLGIDHERLEVIQGDLLDVARVGQALAGADAVLSVLGPTSNEPTYLISRGMDNILMAMQTHGVHRLVQSVGAGVGDPHDRPNLFDRLIRLLLRLTARHVLEDMQRVGDKIRASDRDWTLVRVPMLTDGQPTGKLRVGYLGQGVGPRVTRLELASFMLQQVGSEGYLRQSPVISS
jgi:putative NADH-flavin reductase